MQINWINFITGCGAIVLIGSEALFSAAAAAWAIGGVSGLSTAVTLAIAVVTVAAALAATIAFARSVHRVEPLFERRNRTGMAGAPS